MDVESANVVLNIHQCYVGDVGCVVWDAALVLSKYVDFVNHKEVSQISSNLCAGLVADASRKLRHLNDCIAIELGSGTGLVGLVTAVLGCKAHVTDLEDLVPLLQKNIEANDLKDKASASVLKWGEQKDGVLPEADLLLVADCVYYDESLLPLLETIAALSGPDTMVLISYEDRDSEEKQALQQTFWDRLRAQFDVEEVPTDQLHPEYRAQDIHVVVARKKRA